ncbi:MAG: hypothetical protein ACFBSE_22550, partial [Prochloraceae cyanobacterium]
NDAKLDLRGSFVGTTADGIELGTNGFYSATNPSSSNLLSVQPGALFTNAISNTPRAITNQGKLQVDSLQTLTLSADTINNNGSLIAPGGNIFLEAINGDINTSNIDTSDAINGGGDIFLSATGNITINRLINASGRDFTIDNSGDFQLFSDTLTNSGSVTLLGGNKITFSNGSNLISNGVFGGTIHIETRGDLLFNNAGIESVSLGNIFGQSGDITIKANAIELIDTINSGRIVPLGKIISETLGTANAGNINIDTNFLRLDGAAISSSTIGSGSGGNINITSSFIELIERNNLSQVPRGITSQTGIQTGNAGNINIDTNFLRLDGAVISTTTFGSGRGGNINISAKDFFNAGAIVSDTFLGGEAGEIFINTENLRLINGGSISSSASINSTGNSGKITIFADNNISILNNSYIRVADGGTGTNSDIFTKIIINANSLNLDRGFIFTTGNINRGGNIEINLNEILTLSNFSLISAGAAIFGGQIFFEGSGGGGDITINSPVIIAFPRDNLIEASAFRGNGGNININTKALFGYPQFLTITANSELAIDGEVNINGLDNNITRGTISLPTSPLSAEDIIANDPCEYKNDAIARGSSFTIIGKGGIAPNPLKSLEEDRPIVEWSKSKNLDRIAPSHKQIDRNSSAKMPIEKEAIQAVGWWRKPDGTIVLTANPTEARSLDRPLFHPHCQQK